MDGLDKQAVSVALLVISKISGIPNVYVAVPKNGTAPLQMVYLKSLTA